MSKETEIPGKHYYGVCVHFDESGNLTVSQTVTSTSAAGYQPTVYVHKEQLPAFLEMISAGGKL